MTKRLLFLLCVLLSGIATMWAQTETPYSPTLEVNFRTAAGNTAWQSGYPKDAASDGNTTFEGNYFAGLFALQKYTIPNLNDVTQLVLTLYAGSGTDAIRVWSFPNNSWTAASSVDDMVNWATQAVGFAPRATEGTANTPLVSKGTWGSSELSPRPATFTISGTALATLKANASTDGTFTLMFTDGALTSNSSRRYLSTNSANAEASRPVLVATATDPAPKTAKIGDTEYVTLADAWAAAVAADADATIEVSGDQTLTARLTWNKAHTLNIVPTKDITIKGHKNGMWFLVNTNKGVLNIGSADHSITLDGQNNEMAYDVTKGENATELTLTNVTFQNFNLNEVGHLVGSRAAQDVKITLDKVTFKNCTNPEKGFVNKLRVKNDMLILKGYLNQEGCTGTTIYSLGETKSSGTTGRIKIDDSAFTANSIITINFDGITKADGVVVVIGTSADNATKFALTDSEWSLARKSNGDLYMTAPATPTAKIGDTEYADLEAALAAVKDGETITLLADQEIKARVNIANMAVTINGGKTIKRATSYKGILLLTATGETPATLTLDGVTLDGQDVEATGADIEASNKGTVVLKDVTIKNNKTTASAAVVNKSGGKLELKGNVAVPSIFVGKNLVVTATDATIASPITLVTENGQSYKLLVEDGAAKDYTCASFRLSQQQDGVYAMPLPVAGSYTHPALLHTATDIATAKGRLDQEPFKSAYAALETASAGTAAGAVEYLKRMDKKNWESKYADYNNYTRAVTDAKLAYELALRYQLKGSDASATAAVNILNNWATTNKGFLRLKGYANNIPDPNEYLMTIQAYQFANAAELLRDYSGWTADSQTAFKNWIRQTFADVAILFLENHDNNSNALHYWLNWDLAALSAMISVGVLCDDKALVDYALSYVDNGAGTGNKANAVVATHNDPDSSEQLAQCQESGRDQGHSTLDVTLMGVLCQTAQNNGADLFTPYKALEMAEYVGKYNLKDANGSFVYTSDKVPFTTYSNGEVEHKAISEESRGTERPCWELFHAYAKKNSKADAYTEAWVNYYRTKNAGGETTSGATDELGFGTLMYGAEVTVPAITVTVKNASRVYGDANPAFEYTLSGGTEEQLGGRLEITTEAVATSKVGEYAIKATKGTATYANLVFVDGTLTITKTPLTITAKSYTIKQGDALPTFEAEYSGFKNNETASVLSAQPTFSCSATSASEPGTYDIIVSGADATNYDIDYVKGTLTISATEVRPVTETETTTFSEDVNENTDLSNTIIDNTYYTMNAENGDGYDATEQAIVLNSTTTAEQMNTVQNAQVGDATMQENYNGIIFEVPAGSGTITVEVKTNGSHMLNVQIGNGEPTKITKSERGTADVPYNVTDPTYVYLYASASGASGAPQRAAATNSVLLYSYKVDVLVNGISVVTYDNMENAKWYDMNGRQLPGKPTKRGLYIVNGHKVVVK